MCSRLHLAGRASALVAFALALAACAPPRIDGAAGAPASPSTLWPVPAPEKTPPPPPHMPAATAITAALASDASATGSVRYLGLPDVIDLVLRNNPATRESWALAQSAVIGIRLGARCAASHRRARRQCDPLRGRSVQHFRRNERGRPDRFDRRGHVGDVRSSRRPSRSRTSCSTSAGAPVRSRRRASAPSPPTSLTTRPCSTPCSRSRACCSPTWRRARCETSRSCRCRKRRTTSQRPTERQRLGVATIQDVLQTRTQLAQARLQLATYEGNLQAARGNLAFAMGLPANARFEVPAITASDSVADVLASVDTLINRADHAASRARGSARRRRRRSRHRFASRGRRRFPR